MGKPKLRTAALVVDHLKSLFEKLDDEEQRELARLVQARFHRTVEVYTEARRLFDLLPENEKQKFDDLLGSKTYFFSEVAFDMLGIGLQLRVIQKRNAKRHRPVKNADRDSRIWHAKEVEKKSWGDIELLFKMKRSAVRSAHPRHGERPKRAPN